MMSKIWTTISALSMLLFVLSCGAPSPQGVASNGTVSRSTPLPVAPTMSRPSQDISSNGPIPTATPPLPPPTLPPDSPISNDQLPVGQSNGLEPYLEYKPPFLPIKFTLDASGISVEGDSTIVTPLGSFTFGASLPIVDATETLVILRDTKKGKDALYRINAGRKLRIVVDGRTTVEVSSNGIVLIDITEGKVKSIEIIDGNQLADQSTSPAPQHPSDKVSMLATPHISDPPVFLIPDPGEIPSLMQQVENVERTNEYAANETDNPAEFLRLFQQWGRVTGHSQHFVTKEDCSVKTGLVFINIRPSLYETSNGTKQSLDWNKTYDQKIARIQDTDTVGEEAFITYGNYQIMNCNPPLMLQYVSIMFRRYNAVGSIMVSGVSGTVTDDYMLSIATRLAQLMDAKFASAVD